MSSSLFDSWYFVVSLIARGLFKNGPRRRFYGVDDIIIILQ